MEVRLLAMCLLAFAGFLRCDQLIKLNACLYRKPDKAFKNMSEFLFIDMST